MGMYTMGNPRIVEHRLGVARKALERIAHYEPEIWDDDTWIEMQYIAKNALEEMKKNC